MAQRPQPELAQPAGDGDAVAVTFVVPRALADGDVAVVGEFNGRDERSTPLRPEGDVRTATIVLDAGRTYEFRYCVDGNWFNDETADRYAQNAFGGHNGVIDLTDGP